MAELKRRGVFGAGLATSFLFLPPRIDCLLFFFLFNYLTAKSWIQVTSHMN